MLESKKQGPNQETSLNLLRWLIENSNVGYKGNPPPFEVPKTQGTVELAKKRVAEKFVGHPKFLLFGRRGASLTDDARPTRHLRGVNNTKFERRSDPHTLNYFHQRIDPLTRRPEIVSALCWDLVGGVKGAEKVVDTGRGQEATETLDKKRMAGGDRDSSVASVSQKEGTHMCRAGCVRRPKFTNASREYRSGCAWYRGTQLEGSLQVRVRRGSPPITRNCIRLQSN